MTSEIRTNSLTSRAGLSTVTLTDSGPMFSGITTFVDNSTFSVGTGGTIHAPATNTLNIGVNNTESLRIDSNSNLKVAGIVTATHFYGNGSNLTGISAGTSLSGSTNNTVCTVTGANAIQGESNLTFDGTNLRLGTTTAAIGGGRGMMIANSSGARIKLCDSDQGVDSGSGFEMIAGNGGTGYIWNRENQAILIGTNGTERMRVTHEGSVGIGTNNSTYELEVHDGSGAAALRLKDGSNNVICDLIAGSTGGHLRTTYNHPLLFSTNQVERLRIHTTGQVEFKNGSFSNNVDCVMANGGTMEIGAQSTMKFRTATNERLRITSAGTVNIGGSSQTTHLLHLQSTGDAGIHIRADSDNSGENDNPYLSMSQDGSSNQELKIGQNGDAGQNFPTSFANAPFIHANHSSAYPLQLAHMDNMCVNIAARKNEIGLNDYNGNTIAGMEIHHRGNDTGAALKFSGHNNTGTPGVKTFTQLTHLGGDAKFMIHHVGQTALQIGSTRRIDVPAVYGTAISSPMRDLYVESTGQLGYDPSIRASKINIADNTDVSWLYNLAPKTYNKRKRVSRETNEWTNEAESDLQYGLIAEDVESVNSNICFYDVDESNNKTLAGVTYSQLITPILKAVQDLKSEIDNLQQENIALRARVTNLEGN